MLTERWEDEVAAKLERFIDDELDKTLALVALCFDPAEVVDEDVLAAAWDAAVARVAYFLSWHGYRSG